MHYRLYAKNPSSHFIDIECRIENITQSTLEFQLPAWRPGRYELQHFAKNIQQLTVCDAMGFALPFRKLTKDRWIVETAGVSSIVVSYNYYANVQNAGSSYIDNHLLYVNPVNLCIYAEGRLTEPCWLTLDIPNNYEVACGLKKQSKNLFKATDYYELVDSPLMASATLQYQTYEVQNTRFYVWMQGDIEPNWPQILSDFERFTIAQIAMMGSFPEAEYHFLNLVLPTPYYHGVEHRHSTVIVLGPADDAEGFYSDLLGVSSHELFHAWNVIRIRPKELLPYDFTKENYFSTCFVVEGVTTYYGDLFLRKSGVFDDETYLKELEVCIKRHFENNGRASQSLAESSFDLWLDGYEQGVPHRKVSVYQKGALAALILDLTIRKIHNHQRSLDDVMRQLWQNFGIPFVGYSFEDYKNIVEQVAGQNLDWYWSTCILGNEPLEPMLNQSLNWVGLEVNWMAANSIKLSQLDDVVAHINYQKWVQPIKLL
jgi:predicted metalloprotease with PDZ domain